MVPTLSKLFITSKDPSVRYQIYMGDDNIDDIGKDR